MLSWMNALVAYCIFTGCACDGNGCGRFLLFAPRDVSSKGELLSLWHGVLTLGLLYNNHLKFFTWHKDLGALAGREFVV